MVLLMFGLSLVIATAQEQLVSTLRASVTQVKRWGGVILILIGLWLIALGIWADTFARIFPV
jgi:predicted histidine transporter YuiF (NhaC family)